MKRATHFHHYFRQAVYAGLFMWLVLFAMDQVTKRPGLLWAVGASTLASSTFITFCTSRDNKSHNLQMIGSYLLSILVGIACSHLQVLLWHYTPLDYIRSVEIATAISVSLSFILQTILYLRHPPAASLSLVLTLEPWNFSTILVIIGAVFLLAFLSVVLKNHFRAL